MMDIPEDIEAQYEKLLSEYNRIKEEIKEIGSEKEIQLELHRYEETIGKLSTIESESSTIQGSQIEDNEVRELQLMIAQQIKQINDQTQKNAAIEKEYQEKINEKRRILEELSSSPNKCQELEELQQRKNQVLNEIEKIRQETQENQNKFSLAQEEEKQLQNKVTFLLDQKNSKQQEKSKFSHTINRLLNEVETSKNEIIQLNNQLQSITHTCKEPAQIGNYEQEIKEAEGELKKLKNQYNQNVQEKQNLTAEYEKAKKAKNKVAEEESKLKKNLENQREKQEKLRKNIAAMNEEKTKLEEKKKNKGKDKPIDYKVEVMKLKDEARMLEAELNIQIRKKKDYEDLRKTYVKQEQLVQLKEELDILREKNKPLEGLIGTFAKLEDSHKKLTKAIEGLKKNERRLIAEKQNHLNQIKEKLKELMESKTFYEKNISHCSNKLNEYMKEYPNHDKEKTAAKQREKEKRAEEKKRKKEEEELEKKRREAEKNTSERQEDLIPKFLPQDSEASSTLLSNQNMMYGGIGLAVIAIVIFLMTM